MEGGSGPSGRHSRYNSEDESILNTRSLEAFGRKVTATAGQIISPFGEATSSHYQSALGDLHRELRQPIRQRQLFNLSQASPRELFRSKLSVNEIQHRALTYLPEELLHNVPETASPYSLFQGFEASLPEDERGRRRKSFKPRKLLGQGGAEREPKPGETPALSNLRNEKHGLDHRLEMLGVRKNMCSTEIREIDNKISNLNNMRGIVLDRLADLEQEETQLERDMFEVDTKLEDLEEELEDEAAMAGQKTPVPVPSVDADQATPPDSPTAAETTFMSESIYEKLPTPKKNRPKPGRRKTTHILHEHLQSGSKIREFQAHNDAISAMDFDVPFGTMVTAALDDTVRVWDLNAGRCIGLLEGHLSSVRCLQVEDNIVATGSMDASVRLWDLNQADYTPSVSSNINKKRRSSTSRSHSRSSAAVDDDDADVETPTKHQRQPSMAASTKDCELFTLSAHVAEVTALHFQNATLISGSADKTLRQWDLEKGRCVQTLDVLWAAAQASSSINTALSGGVSSGSAGQSMASSGRTTDASADFVGALQCFDAALACGTADGMVRLWDLRSGQVHRSLVGHTGPVTSLQFDDVHLVTGSADRSIRIWDLRTGSIVDAWGYDNSITSMMFDSRRVVAAAGESIVKVYDKTDGRHWDCGTGADDADGENEATSSVVETVRIKDGYLIEGRRDGVVGVWSC